MAPRSVVRVTQSSPKQIDAGLLLLRLWFGLLMAFGHGWSKLSGLSGFADKVAAMGLPAPTVMATMAALSEFAGGLLLALGLLTRFAGVAVLGTMLVAAFVVHADDPFLIKKEFALAYAAVALALAIAGPGGHSLDAKLFGSSSDADDR